MESMTATSYNSVFAVRFAHRNAFGTSQTLKTLVAKKYDKSILN